MKQEIILNMCISLLIILFLYTGLTKLYRHESFERVLTTSPLVSVVGNIIAWFLPVAEIILTILLAIKRTSLIGLYLSAILLFCFTSYLIFMVLQYPKLPCHCGGVISKMSWKQHILFNIFFFIIAIVGIKMVKHSKGHLLLKQIHSN